MTKNSSDLVQPPFPMPYDQADKKSFFDDLPNYLLKNNSWYPRFPNRNLFSVTRRFILSPQKCLPIFASLSLSCNPSSYRTKFYSIMLQITNMSSANHTKRKWIITIDHTTLEILFDEARQKFSILSNASSVFRSALGPCTLLTLRDSSFNRSAVTSSCPFKP